MSISLRFSVLIWVLSTLIGFSKVAADGLNYIDHPEAGEVVPVGIPYTIQWSPGTPGPVIISIHFGSDAAIVNITASTPNNGSYTWTPDKIFAQTNQGQNYYMSICDVNTRDCTYTFDGRFSFSDSAVISTTASSSSTTSLSSTTTSTIETTSSTASSPASAATIASSSSNSNSNSNSNSSSTNTGLIVGASVGATLSVVLILATIGFFAYRHRKKNKRQPFPHGSSMQTDPTEGKSQLPSDSAKPKDMSGTPAFFVRSIGGLEEIDGNSVNHSGHYWSNSELPANESVGSQLDRGHDRQNQARSGLSGSTAYSSHM